MIDRPDAAELLEALAEFLERDVRDRLAGGARFRALVGANTARILAREFELGADIARAEQARLTQLLSHENWGQAPFSENMVPVPNFPDLRELNGELCRRIAAGEADAGPWRAEVLAHLRECVREKLTVDNPRRLRDD